MSYIFDMRIAKGGFYVHTSNFRTTSTYLLNIFLNINY